MNKFKVEIVYIGGDQSYHSFEVDLVAPATVLEAIQQSQILQKCPEINLEKQKVGVYGKLRKLEDLVFADDRVEIYRPLLIDPKEARRKKARLLRLASTSAR